MGRTDALVPLEAAEASNLLSGRHVGVRCRPTPTVRARGSPVTVPNFSRADIIVGYALTPLCIVWVLIARALSERAQQRERRALVDISKRGAA